MRVPGQNMASLSLEENNKKKKHIIVNAGFSLVHTHNYLLISQLPTLTMDFKCSKGLHFALLV